MSLKEDIFVHERECRKLAGQQKAELKRRILSLPVNSKAKPCGKGFILNFADLDTRWSAEYYNFDSQYRLLAEVVDKAESPLSALLRLRRAVKERRIVVGTINTLLHPVVVTSLKKVLAA